jgi:nitroreductase
MIELLKKRRSIRKFKNLPIERDKMDNLVKALLLAPSASNQKPWEFVLVTDKMLLEKLSTVRKGSSAFLKDAALGIVLLGESDRRDTWVEDTTIAGILAQLTAHSMGLGSCWVHIRGRMYDDSTTAEQFVREILEVPEQRSIESIIAVGYPDEQKSPHSEEDLEYRKVYSNKYGLQYR